MKGFTLYVADYRQNPRNVYYRHRRSITNAQELREACRFDYCAALFRDYRRQKAGFTEADVLILDVDNSHTDLSGAWLTPEGVAEHLQGVAYCVHFSRHHLREKDGKIARPKFHLFIPTELIRSSTEYEWRIREIADLLPGVDRNALDASRLFFGTEESDVYTS